MCDTSQPPAIHFRHRVFDVYSEDNPNKAIVTDAITTPPPAALTKRADAIHKITVTVGKVHALVIRHCGRSFTCTLHVSALDDVRVLLVHITSYHERKEVQYSEYCTPAPVELDVVLYCTMPDPTVFQYASTSESFYCCTVYPVRTGIPGFTS
jgi:hypothetical protein